MVMFHSFLYVYQRLSSCGQPLPGNPIFYMYRLGMVNIPPIKWWWLGDGLWHWVYHMNRIFLIIPVISWRGTHSIYRYRNTAHVFVDRWFFEIMWKIWKMRNSGYSDYSVGRMALHGQWLLLWYDTMCLSPQKLMMPVYNVTGTGWIHQGFSVVFDWF